MGKRYTLLLILFLFINLQVTGQDREFSNPVYIDSAVAVPVSAISKKQIIPPSTEYKIVNPRNRGINTVVPGKGLPRSMDPTRQAEAGEVPSKSTIISFNAAISQSTPTDPTGAVGPDHYVNGWNSAFSIYDKSGNRLMPPAALSSIGGEFTNENLGDPIILYDEFANRFLITQFSDTPESFLVAISRGSNPLTDGWYTYRFTTNGALPDYPKISVWSDGYYVTTNKNSRTASTSQVVYVFERDRMLEGETARVIGFPLPGINTNGFYSPAGFHAMGGELPPKGNSPIIYMQDDAWAGVSEDHLKIWNINVNWVDPQFSTIAEYQELGSSQGVNPFIATFDGGSFANLQQPGENLDNVDALQATMMYMTQYRRFTNHNSAVMNFVVDIDPSAAEHAGIRWYELRQPRSGGPWTVYQEGTYAPDKSDRWSGSIGMDRNGNIGLGFTIMDKSIVNPIYPSIRYTGRYANDPRGVMTLVETSIIDGRSPNPDSRYGDYAHLTIDPVDDATFWHNAEYFEGPERLNRVGVFKLIPDYANDVGIIAIKNPISSTMSSTEEITVSIWNYGSNVQSNIPVSYTIDGGNTVTEVFTGTVNANSLVNYTFTTTANLSAEGTTYSIEASTNLAGDEYPDNDAFTANVTHLFPKDVGITAIYSPQTGLELTSTEDITVTIENFGGEPQSNIPVAYRIENNPLVREVYPGTIEVGDNAVYTFNRKANLSAFGRYMIYAETNLPGDGDRTNDGIQKSVTNLNCIPTGSNCIDFGDGIFSFQLEDINNERIACTDGYADFIRYSTDLDRSKGPFIVRVQTLFNSPEDEQFSLWIDFNDNGVFDDNERLISNQIIPSSRQWHEYELEIPKNASLGHHLMRVRAGDVSLDGDLNDPCNVMAYGSTNDYSVRIIDSTLTLDDFLLNDAALEIVNFKEGKYSVFLETTFDQPLRVTIHNILGQKMLENQVETNGRGYLYEFDMSYAANGVYLLRIGTRQVGRVKRFIVNNGVR